MTPRDLVIAFNFAPYADASAITTLKRVVARGVPVDVVSNRLDSIRSVDDSPMPLVAPLVHEHVLLNEDVSFARWESIRDFTMAGLPRVRQMPHRHERIYSRSMWAHSHFLAAALKLVGLAPTWVAEFSILCDVVSTEPREPPRGSTRARSPICSWQASHLRSVTSSRPSAAFSTGRSCCRWRSRTRWCSPTRTSAMSCWKGSSPLG